MIAVFDFDGVLWSGEASGSLFYDFLEHDGIVGKKPKHYKKISKLYQENPLKAIKVYSDMYALALRDVSVRVIRDAAKEFMYSYVSDNVNIFMLGEFLGLKNKGYTTAIISATLQELLDAFPFEFDAKIGSLLENENGYYTGNIIRSFELPGRKKEELLKLFPELPTQGSLAFGDSLHDIELFESVEKPIATNPDKFLERYAVNNNIQIRWL